jgi:hypothetical protein
MIPPSVFFVVLVHILSQADRGNQLKNKSTSAEASGRLAAVDDNQADPPAKGNILSEQVISDADARLAARLKHILELPGISDKDRQLVERNLKRLQAAKTAG